MAKVWGGLSISWCGISWFKRHDGKSVLTQRLTQEKQGSRKGQLPSSIFLACGSLRNFASQCPSTWGLLGWGGRPSVSFLHCKPGAEKQKQKQKTKKKKIYPSMLGYFLVWSCIGLMWASHCWELMGAASLSCLEDTFLGAIYCILQSFHFFIIDPWGERFDKGIYIGLSSSKSFTLMLRVHFLLGLFSLHDFQWLLVSGCCCCFGFWCSVLFCFVVVV